MADPGGGAPLREGPDDVGPLYRRMHRRTALAMVWSAGAWFVFMAGSGLVLAMIGPDGQRPWTGWSLGIAGVAGVAFAAALGSTMALLAFLVSPLWESYGPQAGGGDGAAGVDDKGPVGGPRTPESMGFRSDRATSYKRR